MNQKINVIIYCNTFVDPDAKVLHFPRKINTDRVEMEHLFEELSALTVTFWVQMDPATAFHAIISYAVIGNSNEIFIYFIGNKTEVLFKDKVIE